MPRGGFHTHAERWGRKKKWRSASDTKPIRVPEELVKQVLEIAHSLDEGITDYVTKSKTPVIEDKADCVTKANKEETIGDARELLKRVAWKLKSIAKGNDPGSIRPGITRKVPERIQAVADEIEQWLGKK